MENYIYYFESASTYNTKRGTEYSEPWVSYTKELSRVNYNKSKVELLEDCMAILVKNATPRNKQLITTINRTSATESTAVFEFEAEDMELFIVTFTKSGETWSMSVKEDGSDVELPCVLYYAKTDSDEIGKCYKVSHSSSSKEILDFLITLNSMVSEPK